MNLRTHCEYWKSSMFFDTGWCTLAKQAEEHYDNCSGIVPLCVVRMKENVFKEEEVRIESKGW